MTKRTARGKSPDGAVQKAAPVKRRRKKRELPELDAVIDQMLNGSTSREDAERVYNQLKKRIVERMLSAELTHHLGYEKGEEKPVAQPNYRNGSTPKTVSTDTGKFRSRSRVIEMVHSSRNSFPKTCEGSTDSMTRFSPFMRAESR
jgi:hypothetical protein